MVKQLEEVCSTTNQFVIVGNTHDAKCLATFSPMRGEITQCVSLLQADATGLPRGVSRLPLISY